MAGYSIGVTSCWPPKIALPIGAGTQILLRSPKYGACCYVVSYCFLDTSLPYYSQMKKHARKRSVNMISSSVLYMFIKEENLRLTIYKIETEIEIRYCARWAPKGILGARFFSVHDGNVSSNYKPEFLGAWS